MDSIQGKTQNRWVKMLCFGQSRLDFANEFTERLAKPAFVALIINEWSIIFCILLLAVTVGHWLWKPFSLLLQPLLQPYPMAIFIAWVISALIFLITMHFVGIAGQISDEAKKKEAKKKSVNSIVKPLLG